MGIDYPVDRRADRNFRPPKHKPMWDKFPPCAMINVPDEYFVRVVWDDDEAFPNCLVLKYANGFAHNYQLDANNNPVKTMPSKYHGRHGKIIAFEGKVWGCVLKYEQIRQTCGNDHCVRQDHLYSSKSEKRWPMPSAAERHAYGSIVPLRF